MAKKNIRQKFEERKKVVHALKYANPKLIKQTNTEIENRYFMGIVLSL